MSLGWIWSQILTQMTAVIADACVDVVVILRWMRMMYLLASGYVTNAFIDRLLAITM